MTQRVTEGMPQDNEQYFLSDPNKLRALIAAAGINQLERVLELGAGGGTVAAKLPPCRLTLVERDPALARNLRRHFPEATVLQEDALEVLARATFEVLFSNLPYSLTPAVLTRLQQKTFRCALVAVHADASSGDLERLAPALQLTPLFTLKPDDFSPAQPFSSRVLLVTLKSATR